MCTGCPSRHLHTWLTSTLGTWWWCWEDPFIVQVCLMTITRPIVLHAAMQENCEGMAGLTCANTDN